MTDALRSGRRSADMVVVNPEAVARMTRNGAAVITSVDAGITALLGWSPDDFVGVPSTTFLHPADQANAIAGWMAMITTPGVTHVWRGRYRTADGSWRWVETLNVSDGAEQPTVVSTMKAVAHDEVTVEEERLAREQLLTQLGDALPVGVFQIDRAHQVTFANDRFVAITGGAGGATVEAQLAAVVADDRPRLAEAIAAAFDDEAVDHVELRLAERVCVLSLRPLTNSVGGVTGVVGCISDETDRVRLRRELEVRASTDNLTACLNREATLHALGQVGGRAALVFLDLDHFKQVNDGYGHGAGDRLLAEIARRIRASVRDIDRVGRVGGDEFLVVCPGVASRQRAAVVARRIADATCFTFDVGGSSIEVRASVGVAWTAEPIDADTFVAHADAAMYESKRTGTIAYRHAR